MHPKTVHNTNCEIVQFRVIRSVGWKYLWWEGFVEYVSIAWRNGYKLS